jgi:Zn-dependent alcohol dehydrogenase
MARPRYRHRLSRRLPSRFRHRGFLFGFLFGFRSGFLGRPILSPGKRGLLKPEELDTKTNPLDQVNEGYDDVPNGPTTRRALSLD